jgi:hypothetical protein
MDRWPDISALQPDEAAERARREALVAELRGPLRPRRVRGAKRLALAVLAMLAFGGGVAWAAGLFSADDVSLEAGIACFSEPRLHGHDLAVTYTHASAEPLAKCAKYWREGVMDVDRGSVAPPQLIACTKQDAGVFVFPGPAGLCGRLGLEPLPADFAAAGREAGRAYTAWFKFLMDDAEVPAGECRSPREMAEKARARLAKTAYGDVRVVVRGDWPCARMIDPEGGAIVVFTTSRTEDRRQALGARAALALGPLMDEANDRCLAPEQFEARGKAALARAGLSEVRVHVYRPYEPCVGAAFGYDPENAIASFDGDSRKLWKANSIAAKKAERALKRYERSKGSN